MDIKIRFVADRDGVWIVTISFVWRLLFCVLVLRTNFTVFNNVVVEMIGVGDDGLPQDFVDHLGVL